MAQSSKKILITGAAGFIGSHLVELLLEEGIPTSKLRLLVFNNESLENLPKEDFEIIRGDIRNKELTKKIVKDVDVIYHLAAKIDFEGTEKEYQDVNVTATKNLLEAAAREKIQKFVFFSSIGVYGLPAGIGDIINWDETHPTTYTNLYGRSKLDGEKAVTQAYNKWGIPYAIIRPASVYGPREKGPTYELYKAIKNNRFVMIGNGKNKMHYVFVKDLVKAARQAQNSKRKSGDYIIAGPSPTEFRKVLTDVAESINKSIPSWHIPKVIALPASYLVQAVSSLLGIKPLLYPSRVGTMTTSYYYNISKAKKEIGYDPQIDFKEGSRLTGQWYLENGWL